ncbi:MAG: hypothetical protein EBW42_04325 [Rhodobacterales bacterium]|jgi:uncharacterized protein (UPF0297 family)|nr:hypothetical protein [Rhodobacterales bacterium]NCX70693.1 hypothetical protein [Paracoccaceae bacterium]
MTLEQIQELWSKDAPVDRTELANEASRIPQLHSKYFKIFSTERLLLKKLEQESKQLWKDLWEYYQGNFDYEELKERGWDQVNQRILKADLGIHIDADQNWIDNNLKVAYQKEKVDFLEAIIKSLNNRGFNINAAIQWEKFKVGI